MHTNTYPSLFSVAVNTDLMITHDLTYEPEPGLVPVAEAGPHLIILTHGTVRSWLQQFLAVPVSTSPTAASNSKVGEVTLYCNTALCELLVKHEDVPTIAAKGVGISIPTKTGISTSVSMEASTFPRYAVSREELLTFPLKEFKAGLSLADQLGVNVELRFGMGGDPLFLQFRHAQGIRASLVLATSAYSVMDLGPNRSNPNVADRAPPSPRPSPPSQADHSTSIFGPGRMRASKDTRESSEATTNSLGMIVPPQEGYEARAPQNRVLYSDSSRPPPSSRQSDLGKHGPLSEQEHDGAVPAFLGSQSSARSGPSPAPLAPSLAELRRLNRTPRVEGTAETEGGKFRARAQAGTKFGAEQAEEPRESTPLPPRVARRASPRISPITSGAPPEYERSSREHYPTTREEFQDQPLFLGSSQASNQGGDDAEAPAPPQPEPQTRLQLEARQGPQPDSGIDPSASHTTPCPTDWPAKRPRLSGHAKPSAQLDPNAVAMTSDGQARDNPLPAASHATSAEETDQQAGRPELDGAAAADSLLNVDLDLDAAEQEATTRAFDLDAHPPGRARPRPRHARPTWSRVPSEASAAVRSAGATGDEGSKGSVLDVSGLGLGLGGVEPVHLEEDTVARSDPIGRDGGDQAQVLVQPTLNILSSDAQPRHLSQAEVERGAEAHTTRHPHPDDVGEQDSDATHADELEGIAGAEVDATETEAMTIAQAAPAGPLWLDDADDEEDAGLLLGQAGSTRAEPELEMVTGTEEGLVYSPEEDSVIGPTQLSHPYVPYFRG